MSSSTELRPGAVKLPEFDGDEKNYQDWLMGFKGYAGVFRFGPALKGEAAFPATEDTVLSTDNQEVQGVTILAKFVILECLKIEIGGGIRKEKSKLRNDSKRHIFDSHSSGECSSCCA